MFTRSTLCQLTIAFAIMWTTGGTHMSHAEPRGGVEVSNQMLVQASFDRWRAGTGGPFELLADEARWTITGSSPLSKTYQSKDQFMTEVIRPFNARMEQPLKPSIRNIYTDGDTVIVLFDAESRCVDGQPYRNTYAWFMQMKDGRAVNVTAFFDTRLFDDMWARVAPR
jgi:ketosteroid isomerase-like protein